MHPPTKEKEKGKAREKDTTATAVVAKCLPRKSPRHIIHPLLNTISNHGLRPSLGRSGEDERRNDDGNTVLDEGDILLVVVGIHFKIGLRIKILLMMIGIED